MTPIERLAEARELVEHLEALAKLDSRPTTNAEAIHFHHTESQKILERLSGDLAVAA